MAHDHLNSLTAVIMAWTVMKAVRWVAVSSFPAAPSVLIIPPRVSFVVLATRNYLCTECNVQHDVDLHVSTIVLWQCSSPIWASARKRVFAFPSESFPTSTFSSPIYHPFSAVKYSSILFLSVPASPFTEHAHLASPIVSAEPSNVLTVTSEMFSFN